MVIMCNRLVRGKGGGGRGSSCARSGEGKRKNSFIEDNIARDVNPASGVIKAFVALVHRAVTKKDALHGAESEFVLVVRAKIRPAGAPKISENGIVWFLTKKSLNR